MLFKFQENVGGTTYFYPAPVGGAATGEVVNSVAEDVGGVVEDAVVAPSAAITMFPGTPPHIKTAKTHLAAGEATFYMADDLRLELQHKNALILMQSDANAYPGNDLFRPSDWFTLYSMQY